MSIADTIGAESMASCRTYAIVQCTCDGLGPLARTRLHTSDLARFLARIDELKAVGLRVMTVEPSDGCLVAWMIGEGSQ